MQLVFCRTFVNHPHRYSTPTFRKIGTVRKHQNPMSWWFLRPEVNDYPTMECFMLQPRSSPLSHHTSLNEMVLFSGRSSSLETFIELPHSVSQDEKAGIFPSHPRGFHPLTRRDFYPPRSWKINPKFWKASVEKWVRGPKIQKPLKWKLKIEPAGEEKLWHQKSLAHGTSKEISRRVDSELNQLCFPQKLTTKSEKKSPGILHGHLCNGNFFMQNYTHIFKVESSLINLAV